MTTARSQQTDQELLDEADRLTREIADARRLVSDRGRQRGELWRYLNRVRGVSLSRIAQRHGLTVNRVVDGIKRCEKERAEAGASGPRRRAAAGNSQTSV